MPDLVLAGLPVYRLIHVVAAMALIGGIIGRDVTLARAARASDIGIVAELVALAGRFERLLVQPGSFAILAAGLATMLTGGWSLFAPGAWWLTVSIGLFLTSIPLIALVFLPRGRHFALALDEAVAVGHPTTELSAAFADRAVMLGRRYEVAAIAVIVVLMVTKPF